MKLAPDKRKELVSATITQTLGLILVLSGLVVVTSFAADPSWWSTPGPGSTPSAVMAEQVVTNDGVVTTNYVPDPYAAVTQGQLKQFTARAVTYLNGTLPGGAGTNLNTMVSNWAEDYATNGYATNTANPTMPYKPSDLQAENVGQLKYVGSLVYTQLAGAGYTGLYPSWIVQNTNTDNTVANLGQLKEVFDFDLSTAPAAITDLVATTGNPDEIDLSWTLPAMNNTQSLLIQVSTDGGTTWTTLATLDPTATSYAATGLDPTQSYEVQVVSENASGSTTSSSTSATQPIPAPQYAVIDLGTNNFPMKITDSGYVLCHGSTYSEYPGGDDSFSGGYYATYDVWSNGAPLALQPLDPTTSFWVPTDIGEDGTVVGVEYVSRPSYYNDVDGNIVSISYEDPDAYYELPIIGNLAVWSPGSATPTLTAPPVLTITDDFSIGGGDTAMITSNFSGYEISTQVNAVNHPSVSANLPFVSSGGGSGPTIWSVQVSSIEIWTLDEGPLIDGFENSGELGMITNDYNGYVGGTAVVPLAVNTSNQCLEENDSYLGGGEPTSAIFTIGSSTTLPTGFTPIGGQGTLSNVNALGTTYVLGAIGASYYNYGTPVCWDGTNTITLPDSATIIGVNAMTTTVAGTNGAPQTVPATQVVGECFAGSCIWNMIPSTNSPPTFGNPQKLDTLVPGYGTTNAPWSGITPASINDSGAIVGTATYTPQGTNDTTPSGSHGVMLLPVAFVRETPIGSGTFTPIKDNGLDDKAQLPMYHPDMAASMNTDVSWSGGYVFTAQLSTNLSSTSTASMVVSFQNSTGTYSGTLTETSAGSGVFHDTGSTFTLTLSPTSKTTSSTVADKLQVLVTDSTLGLSSAPFTLGETGPATLNFGADIVLAEVDLSGALSTTAVNTIQVHLSGSEDDKAVEAALTETGVNTRIFTRTQGDMTITINSLSGTAMQISVQDNFLQAQTATLALTETSSTSNAFANVSATVSTFTPLDPGSSKEGVFYIQMPAMGSSVPITLSSGANSVTVNATAVSGSPNLLRTPPLALLAPGTSGSYSGITTLQIDGTNPVCATIFGSKIDPKPTGGALIGRALNAFEMPGELGTGIIGLITGDTHLNNIEQTLIGSASANIPGLGWTVTKDQALTYADVTTGVSKYSLFYVLAHGGTPSGDNSTSFVGFSVWPSASDFVHHPLDLYYGQPVLASTISSNIGTASYKLAFINGCASADGGAGETAFAAAFKNTAGQSDPSQAEDTAYVGWTDEVEMGSAVSYGEKFFIALQKNPLSGAIPTVQNAVSDINAQINQAPINGFTTPGGTVPLLANPTGQNQQIDLNQ